MAVEISGGSRICGRGIGKEWDDDIDVEVVDEVEAAGVKSVGLTGGKYLWKKIVWRTPG